MSKVIIVNNTLQEVRLDDNQIGLIGLQALRDALKTNSGMKAFVLPIMDIYRVISDLEDRSIVPSLIAGLQRIRS